MYTCKRNGRWVWGFILKDEFIRYGEFKKLRLCVNCGHSAVDHAGRGGKNAVADEDGRDKHCWGCRCPGWIQGTKKMSDKTYGHGLMSYEEMFGDGPAPGEVAAL